MTYPHNEMDAVYEQPIAETLAQYDEIFGGVDPVEQGDYKPLPDGNYQAKVERAEVKRSKTSGRPMLELTWLIIGPTHQGRLVWQRHMLDRKEGWPFLKGDLAKLGCTLEQLSAIEETLPLLLDKTAEIYIKIKDDYTNVYINKRLDLQPEETGADMPF